MAAVCAQCVDRVEIDDLVLPVLRVPTPTRPLVRRGGPPSRWGGPPGVIDTETRWEQARWLLHDSLKPEDRLAGLLVLLYAQRASAINHLTLDHLQDDSNEVRLRIGREPVVLPEPLATLARQVLVADIQDPAELGAFL